MSVAIVAVLLAAIGFFLFIRMRGPVTRESDILMRRDVPPHRGTTSGRNRGSDSHAPREAVPEPTGFSISIGRDPNAPYDAAANRTKNSIWVDAEGWASEPLPVFNPRCPYCQHEMTKKKEPTRVSHFGCPSCKRPITAHPRQRVFTSMFLTAEQGACVSALEWFYLLFAHGGQRDYRRVQTVLRERFGKEPSGRDVVWGLLNEALTKWCKDKFDRDSVRMIMDEFKSSLS